MSAHREQVRQYWEDPSTISLLDANLRLLEEAVVLGCLDGGTRFADLGCGGGESTVAYARVVRSCLALEQSELLRSRAGKRFQEAGLSNVRLVPGSVLDLAAHRQAFDVVLTQRVLINLEDWKEQQAAIEQVRATLRPGGRYVMIENTYEGHEALNRVRRELGLKDVPIHWHNRFFHDAELRDLLGRRFQLERHVSFDLYYLLTRVFVNLFARFEGYGKDAVKDGLFDLTDPAALKLARVLGERVKVSGVPAFGPIQAFILRRPVNDPT